MKTGTPKVCPQIKCVLVLPHQRVSRCPDPMQPPLDRHWGSRTVPGPGCSQWQVAELGASCCSRDSDTSGISGWREGAGRRPEGKVALGWVGCPLTGRVRNSGFKYVSRRAQPNPKPFPARERKANQRRPGKSLRLTSCRLWAMVRKGLMGV